MDPPKANAVGAEEVSRLNHLNPKSTGTTQHSHPLVHAR